MLEPTQPLSHAPWTQVHLKPRGKARTRVEFHFSPDYVSALWKANALPRLDTRAAFPSPHHERLLLDDVIYIEDKTVFVHAWLVPAVEPEYFHLRVRVAAPTLLTRNGRLSLHWGSHQYSLPLKAGVVEFEDISPPNFSRYHNNLPSHRLRLSFEFESGGKNGKH
ncbi:MAG: hypothetical protein HY741_10970 [Chloroflexi bacterium]|nr:hypothetical protein [Chloroflexota bacterium]